MVLEAAHPLERAGDREPDPFQEELARKQSSVELPLRQNAWRWHRRESKEGVAR